MVTPEGNNATSNNTKPNTESTKPNTNTSNSTTSNNTNKKPATLPQTGNTAGIGGLLLGLTTLLGGLRLRKKNKK